MPVVLRNGKTNEAISLLWDDNWREIIAAFTSDDFAATYQEQPKAAPSVVLESAHRAFISRDVVNSLPVFSKPGYMTKLADSLAKAAKVGGFPMLHETALDSTVKDSKAKALVAAFVFLYDEKADLHFTLNAEDMDFVEFLKPFAKKVIDADGKTYRDDMNTLLMASSSGESV
jgi:hypothetical protein